MATKKRDGGRPLGAEVLPGGGVRFRVWAPKRRKVEVVLEGGPDSPANERPRPIALKAEADGYFSGESSEAGPGTRYRYRLGGSRDALYPDPVSRYQPEGPDGPSEVIDATRFSWSDRDWRGIRLKGQVIYEMHVGTFTREGTWEAAARHLAELADLGITLIELMPVADAPGRFGWGYDGVNLFAPNRHYGRPDDFRRFVDKAHVQGLGVLLDVVYNHFGPAGNYLDQFSDDYVSTTKKTEWGDAINFDGKNAEHVRAYFLANAAYWIEEFHLDGLRIDATQEFHDTSPEHILTAIARQVRAAAGKRSVLVIGENEPQHAELARAPDDGGRGLDALWNDDFHHSAMVALTGRTEAYYNDYTGHPQEFVSMAKRGFLFQGQHNPRQGHRRGTTASGLAPEVFVNYLQNHDQLANSLRGERFHTLAAAGLHRAMTALWLLMPGTPMFFQGQEFAASSPFLYFGDQDLKLAEKMRRSRAKFLEQFPSLDLPETQAILARPDDPATFERCKLDHGERERHPEAIALHRDLLTLRRKDPAFRNPRRGRVDGAVLDLACFVLRYFGTKDDDDRLLVVNLGFELHLHPASEPLLAPLPGMRWETLWSSEDPRYGGGGTPPLERPEGWRIPGQATVALFQVPEQEETSDE